MFVACSLPSGLIVRHNGQEIHLNGGHTGLDAEALPRNGSAPDDVNRVSGFGLTEVTGAQADALKEWMDISAKGNGPVRSGALVMAGSRADAVKEAKANEGAADGFGGLDASKDLPKGLETADDTKKG